MAPVSAQKGRQPRPMQLRLCCSRGLEGDHDSIYGASPGRRAATVCDMQFVCRGVSALMQRKGNNDAPIVVEEAEVGRESGRIMPK